MGQPCGMASPLSTENPDFMADAFAPTAFEVVGRGYRPSSSTTRFRTRPVLPYAAKPKGAQFSM